MLSSLNIYELIAIVTVLIMMSFVLAGIESALLSINPLRLLKLTNPNHTPNKSHKKLSKAKTLNNMFLHPDRLLVSVLVSNSAVNLTLFVILAKLIQNTYPSTSYFLPFLLLAPLYLIWGELLPKMFFKRYPLRLLMLFLPIIIIIFNTVGQLLKLIRIIINLPLQFKSPKIKLNKNALAHQQLQRENIKSIVNYISQEGNMTKTQSKIINNIIDFHDTPVKKIMMPIDKLTCVPKGMPILEVVKLARKTKFDQFPVMNKKGTIVGLVKLQDIIFYQRTPDTTVAEIMKHMVKVDSKTPARLILQRLRKNNIPLAAVYQNLNTKPKPKFIGCVSSLDIANQMLAKYTYGH